MTRKTFRHEEIAKDARRRFLEDYAPGERLPSESEMATTYKVSRETVRHARRNMIESGEFYVEQGRGMFITPTIYMAIHSVDGMPEDAWVHDAGRALHRYRCEFSRFDWSEVSEAHRAEDLKVAERLIRDSLGWLIAEIACREIDKNPWPAP